MMTRSELDLSGGSKDGVHFSSQEPVHFAVPGYGKAAITIFSAFLAEHAGEPDNEIEVVCDVSQAFLNGVAEYFPKA
ncbi:hypothetical protein FIU83_07480 [Halomonas sp. THAF5a]|uniref:hypothetical protein n=1 Tax=Halomonas sp. THAF5a TaxID=2587844 RepID=UPI0012678E01|nr:hypothetical protein [Halomonas sp. THAF5a]QFU01479.1 hypothetical protein FIU83_07480 [Halomonas sp. THAF5a]